MRGQNHIKFVRSYFWLNWNL